MATLPQAGKLLKLIEDVPDEQLQKIYSSGLFTDLMKCKNPELVDREAYRRVLKVRLLEFLGIITLPSFNGIFIARERFVINISDNADVKISGMGGNFINWLLDKIEEPIGPSELHNQKLCKGSVDGSIISELGGSAKAKIFLAQLWLLLREEQTRGEKDGWHIVYIEDEIRFPEDESFAYVNEKGGRSVLRAVYFYWGDGGWGLDAGQVSDPGVGCRQACSLWQFLINLELKTLWLFKILTL